MADQRSSQLESTEPQASALHTRPPAMLPDLPPELVHHTMSFLPRNSIPNLMLNRKLRSACESHLYRKIVVMDSVDRSLRLLRTFVLRPDLALLVRKLHIRFDWCSPRLEAAYTIPRLLQPDGVAALALAKNVQSLSLGGLAWVSLPSLAHVREVVSKLELTRMSTITDGNYFTSNDAEASEMFISNLRSILRSQPKLEDLFLLSQPNEAALLHRIEAADVPSLNRIETDSSQCAKPFLNVAPKLSAIYMLFGLDDTSFREQWNGNNIKDLSIEMRFARDYDSASFGRFLACFPNTASLKLIALDWTGRALILHCLDKVAPQLRVLTSLRKLEIRPLRINFGGDSGPTPEDVLKFKTYCPTLERFVDTNKREWVSIPSGENGGGFYPQLEVVER